jgi:hypothetical protein
MSDQNLPRRTFLKGAFAALAAIPVVAAIAPAEAAAPAKLDPNSAQAKALGYVTDTTKVDDKARPSHKPDQKCNNCAQFQGKATDAVGGCNIFPGTQVEGAGWCSVWAKKA